MLDKLINASIIKFGNFVLKSGKTSNIYADFRLLPSFPDLFASLCFELAKFVRNEKDCVVAGVPMGAIPLATMISQYTNLPFVLVRESIKEHGTKKIIEGLDDNKEIILVEDVITSGISVLNTIKIIESCGRKIRRIIAILDRQNGSVEKIRNEGYTIDVLYTLEQFLNYKKETKL